jgi:uncharacterized protein (DUF433 family)
MQLEDYFDFLAPDDIRIKGHRIGIESVLYEYLYRQQTPADIVQHFPSLTLEQVYATILYYHQNKEQVGKYIADWLEFGTKGREEQARNPSPAVERVSRIKAAQMAAERKTVDYQIHPPAPDEPMTQIALSLPDYVSQTAEQYARRLGVSPDEFYAAAVASYVRALQKDDVTQALNQVYIQESSAVDPVLMQMQIASLPNEDW